jgi:hypothetical protein
MPSDHVVLANSLINETSICCSTFEGIGKLEVRGRKLPRLIVIICTHFGTQCI